jgi:leucine-rich repeat protein SHOC2
MEQVELEQIIERARVDRSTVLNLRSNQLMSLPESIGNLPDLAELYLHNNQLRSLPDSIGDLSNLTWLSLGRNQLTSLPEIVGSLHNLIKLFLYSNRLTSLPDSIGNLSNLLKLDLNGNQLTNLPKSIGSLSNLAQLDLRNNQLTSLPDSIGNLSNLAGLYLDNNQLTSLPDSIGSLSNLTELGLMGNSLVDLSVLQKLPNLNTVIFFNIQLPRRYWTKFSEWKPEWLSDEDNAEIRRVLIEQVGYEKICAELNAVTLDTWREYTLIKIDEAEKVDPYDDYYGDFEPYYEPMVLLKMTCPSTAHIHILRVPPEMVSAEAAITWVNQGIHPDDFAVQT